MKKFILLIILLIISTPVFGETIKGGVSYTVEEVRAMAFSGVKKKLPRKLVKDNQIDPNFDENKSKLEEGQKQTELDDRIIYVFEDGWYIIHYKNNIKYTYLYNSIGYLRGIAIHLNNNDEFPYKALTYDENGFLEYLICMTSLNEKYLFDSQKKLIKIDRD